MSDQYSGEEYGEFYSSSSNSESENDPDDVTFEISVTRLLTPYMKIELVSNFVNSLVESINKWKEHFNIPDRGSMHNTQLVSKEKQIIENIKSNVKKWDHSDFIDNIHNEKVEFLNTLVARLLTQSGGRKKTRKSNTRVRNIKRVRTSKRIRTSKRVRITKTKRGIKSKRTRS